MTSFPKEGHRSGKHIADDTSLLCRRLLASLSRSDQRQWAEIYIRGLLGVSGRKTVKRISDEIAGGDAEQCLQQFVNQSTWRSDLIRREVAQLIAEEADPGFWVLEDVVIPKNGRHSVAVDKQFAHSEGRTLNCQLGMALFLSGPGWNCPVNWRLPLPASWANDRERRAKARIPVEEHGKARWSHMLDVIDEAAAEWLTPRSPVVADLTPAPDPMPFIDGLDERGLAYAVRVTAKHPPVKPSTMVNGWQVRGGRRILTRVALAPLPGKPSRERYLATEWSAMPDTPRSVWVTTFGPNQVPRLLEAAGHAFRVRSGLNMLYEDLGLRHFEGRSFPGWHHYTTIISAAAACRLISAWRAEAPEIPPPGWFPAKEHQSA